MSSLAIILARGGSKRIPRKNIRLFHGRPVLSYPLAAARESGCFDEIMVSTDDVEIATIARDYGAAVPFLRSAERSNDHAGSDEAIREVILRYRELGRNFTHVCGIYPTAALATAEQLKRGFEMLAADPALAGVAPVLRFSFPVQRALVIKGGRIPMMYPEYYQSRSQDLEPAYHDAGQWYWLNVEKFLLTGEMLGPNTAGLVLSEMEAQDVDNEDDWKLAELKYQCSQKQEAT